MHEKEIEEEKLIQENLVLQKFIRRIQAGEKKLKDMEFQLFSQQMHSREKANKQ